MSEIVWGIPTLYFIFFGVALLVSAVGFYRLVYFVSVGYGLSIAVIGIISLILFRNTLQLSSVMHTIVLIVYGLRLGLFLLYRDFQTSYRTEEEEVKRAESINNIFIKLAIWISCSLLYTTMFSPVLFHLIKGAQTDNFISINVYTITGLSISLIGILLEAVADKQKNSAKNKEPKMFVKTGLYKVVREPNYFGEILVWSGSFITSITFYSRLSWWVIAITGYICIFLIMLGSAKRLEIKQEKRYGKIESLKEYSKRTPLLFPFLPIYSLKKWKIVLG